MCGDTPHRPFCPLSNPYKLPTALGLTVGLLSPCAGTTTSELLWLHSAWVSNQKSSVVADEQLSQFQSRGGVVVLCVVGNQSLGNGLADGVDLRSVTTTRDSHSDVDGSTRETAKT